MAKNPLGKSRTEDEPYAIFNAGHFEWRVLKTYKLAKNEEGDPYARWFLAAKSEYTHGSFELGDGYSKDIWEHGVLTYASPEFMEAYDLQLN